MSIEKYLINNGDELKKVVNDQFYVTDGYNLPEFYPCIMVHYCESHRCGDFDIYNYIYQHDIPQLS